MLVSMSVQVCRLEVITPHICRPDLPLENKRATEIFYCQVRAVIKLALKLTQHCNWTRVPKAIIEMQNKTTIAD